MKKRLISAVIMIAILVPVFIMGGMVFAAVTGIIAIMAYKEMLDVIEKDSKIPNIIKLFGAICLLLVTFVTFDFHSIEFGISYPAIAILLLALLIPTVFTGTKDKSYTTKTALLLIGSILLLGITYNVFNLVMAYDKWILLFLVIITVMTDSFAYIFGSLLGRNKLVNSPSPNKSWEGTIIGSILGTFVGVLYYINVVNGDVNLLKVVLITLVLSIFGQLGDLLFSKMKRENEIKDFSNLIPGHGGILDRLDSLSIVALMFVLLIKYL